jgi:hypothetical protein
MKPSYRLFVGLLAFSAILAQAFSAMAAPPSNDTLAGATAIDAIPFGDAVDTTEATTDADDDELAASNAPCDPRQSGLQLAKTVWYSVNLASGTDLSVDFAGSDFQPGVIVATGGPGSWSVVTCGFNASFVAAAGETYFLLVFDVFGTTGGQLEINVSEPLPPPEVSLTVDPLGHVAARTGSATINGTVLCSGAADFTDLEVMVSQPVGRFTVMGFFSTDFVCDGTLHTFTAEVVPFNGKFAGGRATVSAFASACGSSSECGEDSVEQRIMLRGQPSRK